MSAHVPIAVAQAGLSWGSILSSTVFSAGFLALIGAMWKTRVPMKQLHLKGEEKLREDLMTQLAAQERDHTARISQLEARLDNQRTMYESRIDYERVVHENELSTMRHRMNNLDQCLTMLLALIEENPSKAQAAAKRVREMREKQELSESQEKATLAAAKTVASASVVPPVKP